MARPVGMQFVGDQAQELDHPHWHCHVGAVKAFSGFDGTC
jgi:hypothetical protein